MAKKIGLHVAGIQKEYGDKRAIEFVKEAGADAIDFALRYEDFRREDSVYSKGDEAVIAYYSELKAYADKLGLVFSQTQGRISGFVNDKEQDDDLVENVRLDCLATSILGAPVCIVYNASLAKLGPNVDSKLMHKLSYDLYTRVLPYAKEYGIKIATKTFGDAVHFISCDFFGRIEEFMKAYKNIKRIKEYKKYFVVCMDTGHTNKAERFGNPNPADTIRILGKNIETIHLNDNNMVEDQHLMPKMGTIDWNDVLNALDEIGYKGVYCLQIDFTYFGEKLQMDYAKFAVKFMRNMLEERENKNKEISVH